MRIFIKPGLLVKPKKTDDDKYAEKLLAQGWVEQGVAVKKSSPTSPCVLSVTVTSVNFVSEPLSYKKDA